jgi:type I restriction enzyme, R subunit
VRRRPQKRADYLLRYTRDFPIAIIEAKAAHKSAGGGLQQAKQYAEILDLRFAYASNGHEIQEFDFLTGQERSIDAFPSPDELWSRLRAAEGITDDRLAEQLLTPCYRSVAKPPRYYQQIAVNRVVRAIERL